jgi:hypothetical protein
MVGKCQIVTVCKKRRRICYDKWGIATNTPAGGGKRKKTTRKSTKKRKTTRKSTKRRSTAKKGSAKPKCKFGRSPSGKKNCYKTAKSAKAGRKARRAA